MDFQEVIDFIWKERKRIDEVIGKVVRKASGKFLRISQPAAVLYFDDNSKPIEQQSVFQKEVGKC